MSLVSLDDQFFDHPKAVAAGEDGANLHVRALAYCRRYNTGGKILKGALPKLSTKKDSQKHAADCVKALLWHDRGDFWEIHDYSEWYSRDDETRKEKQRKLAALRSKRYRDGQRDDTPASRVTLRDGESDGRRDVTHDEAVTRASPRARPGAGASPNSDSDGEKKPRHALELWTVIQRLAENSGGKIRLTVLGNADGQIQELFDQLSAQGWTLDDFDNWASLVAEEQDDWWQGEYTTNSLVGRPDAEGTRSGAGLLRCLEESRRRSRQQAEPEPQALPRRHAPLPAPDAAVAAGARAAIAAMRGTNG